MQISATNYTALAAQNDSAAAARRSDAAFERLFAEDDPRTMLADLTRDGVEGMLKWKVRELEKQIAAKALANRGITKEEIAALPADERIALQQQIMREVAEKLKEAMDEQMRRERGVAGLDAYDPIRIDEGVDIRA